MGVFGGSFGYGQDLIIRRERTEMHRDEGERLIKGQGQRAKDRTKAASSWLGRVGCFLASGEVAGH